MSRLPEGTLGACPLSPPFGTRTDITRTPAAGNRLTAAQSAAIPALLQATRVAGSVCRSAAASGVAEPLRAALQAPRDALEDAQRGRRAQLPVVQSPEPRIVEAALRRALDREPRVPVHVLDPQRAAPGGQHVEPGPQALGLPAVRGREVALLLRVSDAGGPRQLGQPDRQLAVLVAAHHLAGGLYDPDDVLRLSRVGGQADEVEAAPPPPRRDRPQPGPPP